MFFFCFCYFIYVHFWRYIIIDPEFTITNFSYTPNSIKFSFKSSLGTVWITAVPFTELQQKANYSKSPHSFCYRMKIPPTRVIGDRSFLLYSLTLLVTISANDHQIFLFFFAKKLGNEKKLEIYFVGRVENKQRVKNVMNLVEKFSNCTFLDCSCELYNEHEHFQRASKRIFSHL